MKGRKVIVLLPFWKCSGLCSFTGLPSQQEKDTVYSKVCYIRIIIDTLFRWSYIEERRKCEFLNHRHEPNYFHHSHGVPRLTTTTHKY